MKESNEFHEAIADLSADFAFAFRVEPDQSLVVEALSDGFTKLSGYSEDELASRGGWTSVIHPGDMAAVAGMYTDDFVLHYPGRGPLGGTHDSFDGFLAKARALMGEDGSVKRELHDAFGSDDHAVQLLTVTGNAKGRSHTWQAVVLMHVRDGQITLNVGTLATNRLVLGNEFIEFQARFSGVTENVYVPVGAVSAIYAGARAGLRPIHDALMAAVRKFGDFEEAPKKGYVSLRRKKQFATIGPATNTRVEVGLNMKGVPATDRLVEMPPKSMCQYKVKVTDAGEVDAELVAWIKRAYEAAG